METTLVVYIITCYSLVPPIPLIRICECVHGHPFQMYQSPVRHRFCIVTVQTIVGMALFCFNYRILERIVLYVPHSHESICINFPQYLYWSVIYDHILYWSVMAKSYLIHCFAYSLFWLMNIDCAVFIGNNCCGVSKKGMFCINIKDRCS